MASFPIGRIRALLITAVFLVACNPTATPGVERRADSGPAAPKRITAAMMGNPAGVDERAVTKYPFDVRRAEQLMAEVGYIRGTDGFYASPSDGRFRAEVRGVSGGQEEQDTTIVAGYLKEARAFENTMELLPSSTRAVDNKTKGTFPGLTLNNNTLQRGLGLSKWLTTNIGRPETDWVGGNRSGYSNPAFDRLYEQWVATLDHSESVQILANMMKILSEDVGSLPLYYNFQVVAHVAALKGPSTNHPDSTRYGNIHEWTWR